MVNPLRSIAGRFGSRDSDSSQTPRMTDAAELPTRLKHVLEDPSAQAIARSYALAYLDAADSTAENGDGLAGRRSALEALTSLVDDVLTPNPAFEDLLTSPLTGRDNQLGMIERTIKPQAPPVLARFLDVIARHGRLDLLRPILQEAHEEQERREGQQRVIVRSAAPLSDDQLAAIKSRINDTVDFEPILVTEVDASLIGGLVLQVGDTVYDSSLRSRLRTLRGRLRERLTHEIQSGRDRFGSPEGD